MVFIQNRNAAVGRPTHAHTPLKACTDCLKKKKKETFQTSLFNLVNSASKGVYKEYLHI